MKKILLLLCIFSIYSKSSINVEGKTIEEIKANEEKYLEGQSEFIKQSEITLKDYVIGGVEFISEDEYFVYGGVYVDELYESQHDNLLPFVNYYSYNELVWEKLIDKGRYGEFVDATVSDDGVILLANIDSLDTGLDVHIYEIDYDAKIIFEKIFNGSEKDEGRQILISSNYIYLIISTTSNDGDFKRVNKDRDILVIKISRKAASDIKTMFIGNDGNDLFYKATLIEDNLYLYMRFIGDGYFSAPGELEDFSSIFLINERFDYERLVSVEKFDLGINRDLISFKDSLILSSSIKNTSKLSFIVFDSDLGLEGEYIINVPISSSKIISYSHTTSENILLSLRMTNSHNEEMAVIIGVSFIDSKFDVLFASSHLTSDEAHYKLGLSQGGDGDIVYLDFNILSKKLKLMSFKNYVLRINETNSSESIIKSKDLLYNGLSIPRELVSSNLPDGKEFGIYEEVYQINSSNKLLDGIYLVDEYKFLPRVNVKSNQIYDKNILLDFNSRARLNGVIIEDNHQVTDEGFYILELISKQDESVLIPFEVKTLSEEVKAKNHNDSFSLDLNPFDAPSDYQDNEAGFNLLGQVAENDAGIKIGLVILSLVLGVLSSTFTKKLIRRKKTNV